MNASRIVLGTVQLGLDYGISNAGGRVSEEAAFQLLTEAHDAGITLLDSASAYGDSLRVIGAYHRTHLHRFRLISKFILTRPDGTVKSPADLERELHETLQLTGLDSLYCLMFHRADEVAQHLAHCEVLQRALSQGLIQSAGASIYSNEQLDAFENTPWLRVFQLPLNLLDHYGLRGPSLQRARHAGKELHVRSVFLQGLFYLDPEHLPARVATLQKPLSALHVLARKHQLTMQELALRYALSFEEINYYVLGVESAAQLQQNLRVAAEPLPTALLEAIHAIPLQHPHLLNPANWQ